MKPARFWLLVIPIVAWGAVLASACGSSTDSTSSDPTELALTTPPSSSTQNGVAFLQQPVVQLRNADGNDVGKGGVPVTATILAGGGALGGTTTVTTNSSGQAVFTDLTITGIIGPRTVQFNSTGLSSVSSGAIILTPGPAKALFLTTQPSTSAQSGVAFSQQPVVQLRDASGNDVSEGGVSVTAAVTSGSGTLGGTSTVQTNNGGQAVFTNLSLTGIVGPNTMLFSSTNLTSAPFGTIILTPGPAKTLVVTTQPSTSAQSGVAFPQQPVVQLRDTSGNDVSQGGVAVTASIATGAGTLGGATTVQTNNGGQAVFTNLAITGTAGSRELRFSATGVTPDTSTTIVVSAAPVTQLVITTQPADTARSGVAFARQPVVQLRDATGGNVNQSGISVTASVAAGTGTLGGTTTVQTNSSGQAVYTNLAVTGAGDHTLGFGTTGVSDVPSSMITLPTPIQFDVPNIGLNGATGSTRWFVLQVPAGASPFVVSISGGTGDADLYVRYNALPNLPTWDCRPFLTGNNEQCPVNNPTAGSWFILVHGFADYTGATLSVTSQASCSLSTPGDADQDRLPDCVETNTRVFVSSTNTGTDPNNPDTDQDGIRDGDEVLGTLQGLALPAMGVNPLRKDILIEYDWFDDALDPLTCPAHSHRPTAAAVAMVTAAFANAPVPNADNTTGIHIIHDYGQGGAFTGGNLISDADGVLNGTVEGADFLSYKSTNFNSNRNGYFHYVIMPHRFNVNSTSSGVAERPGDDLIVSLYCFGSDYNVAHTIMHELGHNLNLRHGGDEDLPNYKPNYNSVMNYAYQFPGVDNDCTPAGNLGLDYSRGIRLQLNENSLDETQGICGNPPGPGVDWNKDGDALDVGIAVDINIDPSLPPPGGDGIFGILHDFNDWAAVILTGISDADGAMLVAKEIVTCTNPPPAIRR